MPQRNYCKKCKREVPSGSQCSLCGAKLTKAGERLSFGMVHRPVEDWFSWNAVLRLIVPVIALVVARLLLNEQLNHWHWLGVAVVMAGLAVHVFGARRWRGV